MEFRKILALRGPNLWANFPVLEAWVDLGELKDSPSDEIPGFNDRLMAWLPSLVEHRCSVGTRGGFFVFVCLWTVASMLHATARNVFQLSAFRFHLDRIWHVAVLGDRPADDLDRQLRMILTRGEPASLPEAVLAQLQLRRARATTVGPWVEGHYRPGRCFPEQ